MADVVNTNQFKSGMAIEIDGQPFTIVEFQHVKPGKGGAFVRTKVRNIATGAVLDKTFRAGEHVGAFAARLREPAQAGGLAVSWPTTAHSSPLDP